MDGGFALSRDLGVRLEGRFDSNHMATDRDIREGRQCNGLAQGRQSSHYTIWMVVGFCFMVMIVVMVVVLVLVQVSVLVIVVQSQLVVVLVGVRTIGMLVVMVVVG